MHSELWETIVVTAMVFWAYILMLVGLVAFLVRRRWGLVCIGGLLVLSSLYGFYSAFWATRGHNDAWLFWLVPLTANAVLGVVHLKRAAAGR